MAGGCSDQSLIWTMEATESRALYVGVQSALWVILSEQGERSQSILVDREVETLISTKEWTAQREFAALFLDAIRSKATELPVEMYPAARDQLRRYADNETRWWSASQLLRVHAALQLGSYRDTIGKLVEAEAPKSTPFLIEQSLRALGINMKVKDIDDYLVYKGLINERPGSVDEQEGAKSCGACRWFKGLFKK